MKFGEVLLTLGFITENKLDIALREQEYTLTSIGFSEPVGLIFLRNGIITEDQHTRAVIEYFKQVITDLEKPDYVRKSAAIAIKALENESGPGKLSHDSKIALLNKIEQTEERIAQLEKSTLPQKDLIISTQIKTIEMIKGDLETLG
ncbi:MAG: hypothetical protein ABSG94_11650 [Brevinematales bacterium]|jgi:uncharacterized protein (UPF0147 family)